MLDKYLYELTMTNSATNSSIPEEIINIYPENTASMGVWNIKHFLSCLPIYNTIASVLAVKFIIWIEWTLTSIFGLWHALLLHMFGKYPSVGVLIGSGVPPLRSTEYPYCPGPQTPDNLPPQMITMGTQRLEWVCHKGQRQLTAPSRDRRQAGLSSPVSRQTWRSRVQRCQVAIRRALSPLILPQLSPAPA